MKTRKATRDAKGDERERERKREREGKMKEEGERRRRKTRNGSPLLVELDVEERSVRSIEGESKRERTASSVAEEFVVVALELAEPAVVAFVKGALEVVLCGRGEEEVERGRGQKAERKLNELFFSKSTSTSTSTSVLTSALTSKSKSLPWSFL
jgi:hypothetical protein